MTIFIDELHVQASIKQKMAIFFFNGDQATGKYLKKRSSQNDQFVNMDGYADGKITSLFSPQQLSSHDISEKGQNVNLL